MTGLDKAARQSDTKGEPQGSQVIDMPAVEFLKLLWPNQGYYCIYSPKSVRRHHIFETVEEAAHYALKRGQQTDEYFTCFTLRERFLIDQKKLRQQRKAGYRNPTGKTYRTQENMAWARCFFLDLDVGPDKAYSDQREAAIALMAFVKATNLPRPMVVNSGRGLHVYWPLTEDLSAEVWQPAALKLERLLASHELHADPDRISDTTSVLRVPGTWNFKFPEDPRPVKMMRWGEPTPSVSFVAALDKACEALPPLEVRSKANAAAYPLTLPDTPANVAIVEAMLSAIPPDTNRGEWRQVVWAVMASGWSCAPALARNWSIEGTKFDEAGFDNVVQSFDPTKGTTVGTLVHIARNYEYAGPGLLPETHSDLDVHRTAGAVGDVANGQRFADDFRRKLLWIFDVGEWLRFDLESGWVSEPSVEVEAAAKAVIKSMGREAAEAVIAAPHDPAAKRRLKEFERTSRLPHMRAMIEMAKSEPGMTASLVEFDADPMLLGVLNGVLDLRTGTLLPVSPELRVSKRCRVAFDPGADCLRFRAFLKEILPEADVRAFLRRFVGYTITGSVEEQMFAFLHGSGANGKSVLVELLAWLLGDYSRKISTDMLMQQQRSAQGPDPDIVDLKGVRFAYANETEDGRRLSDARVKDMTGGDTLTGRVPYAKAAVRFDPTFQLVIVGNHKPAISDTSNGMWRRVILIPFEQTIPEAERDPNLLAKLKAEGSGILNWAVAGLSEWRKERLCIPLSIKSATAAYRDEQDVLKEFISETCDLGGTSRVAKDILNWTYQNWCKDNGHRPMSATRLTRDLGERGFKRDPGRRHILGLTLRPPTGPPPS